MGISHLPPLTPATLKRAREGLAAARDPAVRRSIERALTRLQQMGAGKEEQRVGGKFRRRVLRWLIHSLFRVRVEFGDRLPQSAALLAPNHLNHIDPFLLLSELPDSPYYYIVGDGRTLYNKWWKRQILDYGGGVIPIERRWKEELAAIAGAREGKPELQELAGGIERDVPTASKFSALKQLSQAIQVILARGDGIILFPEGCLGKVEGQLELPLKRGTALYALHSGVPIIPVALIGTQHLYWRKELRIRFGDPLSCAPVKHPSQREVKAVLTALHRSLRDLLPTDYQEPKEIQLFANFLNHMFD